MTSLIINIFFSSSDDFVKKLFCHPSCLNELIIFKNIRRNRVFLNEYMIGLMQEFRNVKQFSLLNHVSNDIMQSISSSTSHPKYNLRTIQYIGIGRNVTKYRKAMVNDFFADLAKRSTFLSLFRCMSG